MKFLLVRSAFNPDSSQVHSPRVGRFLMYSIRMPEARPFATGLFRPWPVHRNAEGENWLSQSVSDREILNFCVTDRI